MAESAVWSPDLVLVRFTVFLFVSLPCTGDMSGFYYDNGLEQTVLQNPINQRNKFKLREIKFLNCS